MRSKNGFVLERINFNLVPKIVPIFQCRSSKYKYINLILIISKNMSIKQYIFLKCFYFNLFVNRLRYIIGFIPLKLYYLTSNHASLKKIYKNIFNILYISIYFILF